MISLSRNTDLNQVASLKEKIILALQENKEVAFNASAVENVSTPLLQLLLIAQGEAQKNGGSISIKRPSPNFVSAIKDFGCFEYFERVLK